MVVEPDAAPEFVVDVHVQPRAGRRGVAGRHGDAVKVRVQAPPVDGRANAEVARVLADALGVRPGAVTLVRGATSRSKRFTVAGDPVVLAARLAACLTAAEGVDPPGGPRR